MSFEFFDLITKILGIFLVLVGIAGFSFVIGMCLTCTHGKKKVNKNEYF